MQFILNAGEKCIPYMTRMLATCAYAIVFFFSINLAKRMRRAIVNNTIYTANLRIPKNYHKIKEINEFQRNDSDATKVHKITLEFCVHTCNYIVRPTTQI